MSRIQRPDVAGIYAALGRHETARTVRAAAAMAAGRRWVSHAWPAPARRLNGRPARPRSLHHVTQPRDALGRWARTEQS